jgi:hypothetical protein
MPVLRIGSQSHGLRPVGIVDAGARRRPAAGYPQGHSNRHSWTWNGGFKNVSEFGQPGPRGRALENSDQAANYP